MAIPITPTADETRLQVQRALGNFVRRGGVLRLPDGLEDLVDDDTRKLVEEYRRLADEQTRLRSKELQLQAQINSAGDAYREALVAAVRAGTDQPEDPTPELQAELEATRRAAGAVREALRQSGLETMAAIVDAQDTAVDRVRTRLHERLDGTIKQLRLVVGKLRKAEADLGLLLWLRKPSHTPTPLQQPPAEDLEALVDRIVSLID